MEGQENETGNSIFENITEPARFTLRPPKQYLIFQAAFLSIILVITIFGNMAVSQFTLYIFVSTELNSIHIISFRFNSIQVTFD